MPAPTLDGRLLCASAAAYAITGDMKTLDPDPKDVYINGAGFVQPPTVFTAGVDAVDGCLVGLIQDGLVLAFRGTMPLNFEEFPRSATGSTISTPSRSRYPGSRAPSMPGSPAPWRPYGRASPTS